jgi:fructose-1,6-bisphosphatase
MSSKPIFKAVKTGPVTGDEPTWLHDLPVDNLVGAITALSGEVYILRERLRAMERELVRRDVLNDQSIESHEPTESERNDDQMDLDAFVNRIWTEIARDRKPVASVNSNAVDYFNQPDEQT